MITSGACGIALEDGGTVARCAVMITHDGYVLEVVGRFGSVAVDPKTSIVSSVT